MYKCTICSKEYEIKPDYCDCGNDTFDEIVEAKSLEEDFEVEKRKFPTKKVLSILIFILCIISSILVWEINPPSQNTDKTVQKPSTEQKQGIPDIDKIWNSTPPKKTSQKKDNVITVYEKPLPQPVQQVVQQTNPEPFVQNIKKVLQKPAPVQKPQQVAKPRQTQQKPKQQQVQKPKPHPQQVSKPKQTSQTTSKAQPTTPKQPAQSVTKPVQRVSTPVQKTTVPKMDAAAWTNYKNSLRLALLSKLDLVKILGEGDCVVEFSLDNSGKLLNRHFVYKSQNKSVNDQVYLMLMKLPTYKTPPAGYNGEKIRIQFYINNGYYEISFQ